MFRRRNASKRPGFAGQHPDEEVVAVFRQHPVVLRKAMLAFLVIFTLSTLPLLFTPQSQWVLSFLGWGFGLASLVFLYFWISWYFSVYIVTDERLIQIKQRGLFNRRVVDISHNKIQSVNYEIRGVQATMFKFGTIIVQTFVGDLILKYIHNPADVQQKLVKIIREVKPVSPADLGEDSLHEGTV